MHDCGHTFCVDPCRALGRSNPSITLGVYSHRFDKVNDANTTREALSAGSLLSGNQVETARLIQTKNDKPKTAQLRAVGG
jgi:hypothetical protein